MSTTLKSLVITGLLAMAVTGAAQASTPATDPAATPPPTSPATTPATSPATTPATSPATPPASTPAASTPASAGSGVSTPAAAGEWDEVPTPGSCMCSDGSEFKFFVRKADPDKVLFFLQGGGACFSAESCGPGSTSFTRTLTDGDPPTFDAGIFDLANPENPFADYSMVYVPYCTGDVHIGNLTKDYGNGVVVHHNGYINGTTALTSMAAMFPDAAKIVVAGVSAGAVPSPLYAGLAHDLLPEAEITVLADGSGAYPDVPLVNKLIGDNWGTASAIPNWPANAGKTAETWSLPGLFVQAAKRNPKITFARHDYAFDEVQQWFAGLAGIDANRLDLLIDQNEQQIEAGGVDLLSYISPGDAHTVFRKPDFYTEEVNGIRFVDWIDQVVNGPRPKDNHCTECGPDAAGG